MINQDWAFMFNYEELNYLISGTGVINVQDLKTYTKLGNYLPNDKTIVNFWKVVETFT